MFIDLATISVRAGKGGNGSVSFHREKYIASGGPDGGDGGRGGDIIVRADDHLTTLMDFRYRRVYEAENGVDGGARLCSGKNGAPLVIRVPRGTLVRDKQTGALMADLSGGKEILLARGGLGGWGNKHFATPTRQAPRFAKAGLPGQSFEVTLELKLLADVGLIGLPNVGKSSLLSVMSAARPKIADFPFTTLVPNLGVVRADDDHSFVCADIPGLIEGASQGAGLGHDFLRHVERCRLLLHILDCAGGEDRDPLAEFDLINAELRAHAPELGEREMWVVANKLDAVQDDTLMDRIRKHVAPRPLYCVSAATTQGVRELIRAVSERLDALEPMVIFEPDFEAPAPDAAAHQTRIEKRGGVWQVEGVWLERLMRNINFTDVESRLYFERRLRQAGVFEELERLGVEEHDPIKLYELEFEYVR